MPISSAASFLTPPDCSSARRIVSRSTHSVFWRSFSDGRPVVWGAAAPIGFVRGEPDYGVFLYLSFEHSFLR